MFQWFRESWKTVYVKYFYIWCIVYKKKRFQLFVAFSKKDAEAKLFDIAIQLQTNKRLTDDYWQLFFEYNPEHRESKKKTIGEFITSNSVRCRAIWMWESVRWLVYGAKDWEFRPDLVVLDDIDTDASTNSAELINKTENFVLSEIFWGLGDGAQIVFLFNTIKFDGVWPRLWAQYSWGDRWELMRIYYDPNNNVWKERLTDEFIKEKKAIQKKWFDANFLWIPASIWGLFFDLDFVKKLLVPQYRTDAKYRDLRIYWEPQYDCLYWVDTAEWGIWGDNSVIIVRTRDLKLLACYYGKCPPDVLAEIVLYLYKLWYESLWALWVESNNTWISTLDKLKNSNIVNSMFHRESIDERTNRPTRKIWFNTNAKTRPLILSRLDENIRNKTLEWVDDRVKHEMFSFVYNSNYKPEAAMGQHDDWIMAEAICSYMQTTRPRYTFA